MGNTPGGGSGVNTCPATPDALSAKKETSLRTDKGGVSDAYFRSGADDFHGAETLSPTSRHAPNHF